MIDDEPNNDDRDGDDDDICKMRLCPQSPRAKSLSYHLSQPTKTGCHVNIQKVILGMMMIIVEGGG